MAYLSRTATEREIRTRLERLRTRRKLTRYALAKRVGASLVYVKKLEEGRSDPTVGMLRRIAKALGVPLTELLE